MQDLFSEAPQCPCCTKLMTLSRTWNRHGGLIEVNSYECQRCGIVFTEVATGAAPIPERASALHLECYQARH